MATTKDFNYGLEPHGLAQQITDYWISWNSARRVAVDRWKEVIQYIYATSTRETTNNKNEHSHSTHIPKLTQIADNLGANYASALFSSPNWFRWRGADQTAVNKKKRDAIEKYLETKHLNNQITVEMQKILNDWVMYGNCFAMVEYVVEGHIDPDTGEWVRGYEGPKVTRISPYDIVFNPTATSFEKTPKIIREVLTKGDLIRAVEERPELNFDLEMVEKLLERRNAIAQTDRSELDKHIQNKFDGFDTASDYFNSDFIELLHFYGDIYDNQSGEFIKNGVITVADQHTILRAETAKTYSGYPHIYHCGWRLRPDNLWAMGPLDNLVGMQYLIDHLENARADAFDQMLNPDEVHIGNVQEEVNGPQRRFIIDDATGSVQYLRPDTTVLNADLQIQYKEAQMEAYAGAPREAMGIRTPGEKTAFEIQQLLSAAGRLFQHKIEYFDENFLERILNAELEVARRNLNAVDIIEVMDDDFGVVEFLEITKEDITGAGKLVPVGSRHYARQALLAQQLRDFQQILSTDPNLSVHFPAKTRAKVWEELLGFDKFNLYQEFGGIVEQVEAQRLIRTASDMLSETPTNEELLQEQDQANGPPV